MALIVAGIGAFLYGRWLWRRAGEDEKKRLQLDSRHGLDDAAARRKARQEFYRTHKHFDHNSFESDADRGLTVTETYVLNSKGKEIFIKSWLPAGSQFHGVVFLCHGYGDTVTFYAEGEARTLALAGYAVYGMDYPGFGMSEGLHGYIPNFDKLVDEVIEQYRIIKGRTELKDLPCFLFGESMGAAVALRAHLKEPTMWDGAVLVAPMCKIADEMYPPWILVQILIALSHVIPKARLVPGQSIAEIGFRDPLKRRRADLNPVAYVGNPRIRTAVQMLRITECLGSKMHEVSMPMLVLHGAGDRVTDPEISKLLHKRAKSTDKTLRLYEEAWHCLLQGEPDEMIHSVMRDVILWLDSHAAMKMGAAFPQQSPQEFEDRVARAVPSLINFGRFDVGS